METIKSNIPTCPACEVRADNPIIIDDSNTDYACNNCGQKYNVDVFIKITCYCTAIEG